MTAKKKTGRRKRDTGWKWRRFRKLRAKYGSLADVASAAGVSSQAVWLWEQPPADGGTGPSSARTWKRLLTAFSNRFDMTMNEVLDELAED